MDQETTVKSGPGYLLTGFRMLPQRSVRWFVLLPLTANIVVFGLIARFLWQRFQTWIDGMVAWLPQWLSFMEFLLYPILFIAMLGVFYFTFTIVGNFIAAPFNGLLAEKVQNTHGHGNLPEYQLKDWLTLLPRSLSRELRKLRYYLPKALILLILSFIPIINLASPFLWFGFNSWMMGIQYCDFAADNRMVTFNDMIKQLKAEGSSVWGFGASVAFMLFIPFINLLVMPSAVIGATLLWEGRVHNNSLIVPTQNKGD